MPFIRFTRGSTIGCYKTVGYTVHITIGGTGSALLLKAKPFAQYLLADTARMSTRVSVSCLRLPVIQHPSTKLGNPETLSLTGCSTDRSGNQNLTRHDRLMVEDGKSLHSAFRSQSSGVQSLRREKAQRGESFTLPACIPEGAEVTLAADRDTPKFPIFGKTLASQPLVNV